MSFIVKTEFSLICDQCGAKEVHKFSKDKATIAEFKAVMRFKGWSIGKKTFCAKHRYKRDRYEDGKGPQLEWLIMVNRNEFFVEIYELDETEGGFRGVGLSSNKNDSHVERYESKEQAEKVIDELIDEFGDDYTFKVFQDNELNIEE